MTATTCKVTLTNTFHNSTANVVGELVTMGEGRGDPYSFVPPAGCARVRLTEQQAARAAKKLCGIKECECGRHMPEFYSGTGSGPVEVEGTLAK